MFLSPGGSPRRKVASPPVLLSSRCSLKGERECRLYTSRETYICTSLSKTKKEPVGKKTVKITVNRVFCLFSNRKQAWNEVLVSSACERWPLFIGHLAGNQLMRPQRGCLKLCGLNAYINPHASPSAAALQGSQGCSWCTAMKSSNRVAVWSQALLQWPGLEQNSYCGSVPCLLEHNCSRCHLSWVGRPWDNDNRPNVGRWGQQHGLCIR